MDWRDGVEELLDGDYPLSNWEIDFLESMRNWEREPTEKQAEVLERLFHRHDIDAGVF